MWLLAFLGVTVVGDMGIALHPIVEESPIVLIFFLSSGALTSVCYQLLMSCCRGDDVFHFLGC